MPAIVLYHCTFQGTVRLTFFYDFLYFFFVFNVLFVWKRLQTYYSKVPNRQFCWLVPSLTLLDLQRNWTYEHTLRNDLIHV